VLVLGAAGQLGQVIVRTFQSTWRTIGLTRGELDITVAADVRRAIADCRPWAVVNCVGYNEVDKAEQDAERALAVNGLALTALARAARETGAALVHYGSDFVFDGETDRPYREDDPAGPRSVYAASKLLGEWFAADAGDYYVLRVESLFGGLDKRTSSFDRIIDSIAAGRPVSVFTDRTVSPSYVWDIAAATKAVLQTRPAYGVYHCVNTGAATWKDVAEEARAQLRSSSPLEPITMADRPLPAARPRYCALSNDKLRAAGITMPAWQDALARHVRELKTRSRDRSAGLLDRRSLGEGG
jgi:dTDP-4-dehydrorhamnose reductase